MIIASRKFLNTSCRFEIIVWNLNPLLAHVASHFFFSLLEVATARPGSLALFKNIFVFAETGIGHVIRISPMIYGIL